MVYGLWLSAAGLQANQYRQDLIANNLANVDTTGFKRDLAVFTERPIAAREPFGDSTASMNLLDDMTGGTFVAPTFTMFDQGPIQPSSRVLDTALVGEGFYSVEHGDSTAYTRDGRFTVNDHGELVTVAGGNRVLSDGGTPIRIPPDRASDVRFSQDGRIRIGETEIARLGIVDFEDKTSLRKVGGNLIEAPADAAAQTASATVESRALEGSNVDPATTMVSMIEASRAYQLNANLISLQDNMLGRAANDIARLS